MLLISLGLLGATLAGGLGYSFFQGRNLRKELATRTRELNCIKYKWENLDKQALRETGFMEATDAIRGYQALCWGLGDALHNYGTHGQQLSEQRMSYLGPLGTILKMLTMRGTDGEPLNGPVVPQVKSWVNYEDGRGRALLRAVSDAPEELRPLLDGLTLPQLMHLTAMLLGGAGGNSLTYIFERMDICLLTPDGKSQAVEDKRANEAFLAIWKAEKLAAESKTQ